MPSKHANAGLLVRRGLYDNLRSFAELEQRISALGEENSKTVGDAFEVFVEGYLASATPGYRAKFSVFWLSRPHSEWLLRTISTPRYESLIERNAPRARKRDCGNCAGPDMIRPR